MGMRSEVLPSDGKKGCKDAVVEGAGKATKEACICMMAACNQCVSLGNPKSGLNIVASGAMPLFLQGDERLRKRHSCCKAASGGWMHCQLRPLGQQRNDVVSAQAERSCNCMKT